MANKIPCVKINFMAVRLYVFARLSVSLLFSEDTFTRLEKYLSKLICFRSFIRIFALAMRNQVNRRYILEV